MVARIDPSATVTTRSKALIFANVRLPETRSSTINPIQASTPAATTRPKSSQSLKNMIASLRWTHSLYAPVPITRHLSTCNQEGDARAFSDDLFHVKRRSVLLAEVPAMTPEPTPATHTARRAFVFWAVARGVFALAVVVHVAAQTLLLLFFGILLATSLRAVAV